MKKTLTLLSALILGWSTAMAESTITVSINSGTHLRSGSAASAGQWASQWVSNDSIDDTPLVTISGQDSKNNLTCPSGDGITLAEGSAASSYTYTISAPSGYVFTTMSADVVAGSDSNAPTVTVNGTAYTTSTTSQSISASDINSRSFTIALSSSSNNATATFTNFQLTVMTREEAGIDVTNPYIVSTDEEQHWYYIINQGQNSYSLGTVLIGSGSGEYLSFGTQSFNADRIWSFWAGDDGKLAIKNYNGVYVGTAPSGSGNTTATSGTSEFNAIYNIESNYDYYTIGDDNGLPLHAQQSNSRIVRWAAAEGNASLWDFTEVDMSDTGASIASTSVEQGKVTTAIGNKDQGIIRSSIVVQGLQNTLPLTQVKGQIVATSLSDVAAVKAYLASNEQELFVDSDSTMTWREQNGTLLGEGTIQDDGSYTIDLTDANLQTGTNYLWIALDISDEATEGNTVDATITSYTVNGEEVAEASGDPTYSATIFLTESAVLMPMDEGSLYYRIPALTTTADGKRLITLTDDRKDHNTDLPYHCYVVAQYSDDNGKTWSEPNCVAGTADTGGDYGHGDAQLITNRINGDIIGIMTSSPYGTGFYASTVDAPQGWKVIMSHDNGETWTVPVEHTSSLYATGSPNEDIEAGFSGSGAGLQKRDGTLVSPFVGRNTSDVKNYYNIISKDGGYTWEIYGTGGCEGSDEPKVLERNNGDLAISVRATGYNYHNVTTDDGLTWQNSSPTRFTTGITGNACDGEYMVWASTLDGNPWDISFQTLPYNSSRMNVSIALSTDEGETFLTPKTICPRGSAYSAATVLPDGTLGVYYEENGIYGGFTMRYVRFSLDWASDGAYKFTDEEPFHPIQTQATNTMPSFGMNTLMLPFDAELPDGLSAYTTSGELLTLGSGDSTYRAIVIEPYEGTTLKAHNGYIITGEEGDYIFSQDKADWQSTEETWNDELLDGVMRGWYVNKKVTGNGETIYNNLRNIASRGGVGFNRVTSGSQVSVSAYCCTLLLSEADELTLRPVTRAVADGIKAAGIELTDDDRAYTLSGLPYTKGQTTIVVVKGRKTISK